MEYTKYKINLYFLKFPPDSIHGAVYKNKDGSYSVYINDADPIRRQELTILHELAHIRLNHLNKLEDHDAHQLEAELRREYWWHDYYTREEEKMSKRESRLRKAKEEYDRKFGKINSNVGKFFLGDMAELIAIVEEEGTINALGLALEAGFMIGYRRKTYEVLNPLKD